MIADCHAEIRGALGEKEMFSVSFVVIMVICFRVSVRAHGGCV